MGVAGPSVPDRKDVLLRAVQYALKDKAAREALTNAEYRGMNVRVHTQYNISKMSLQLRIEWSDPTNRRFKRCVDQFLEDRVAQDLGLLAEEINAIVKNISLRGELFFFKLHVHFPKHVKKVECDGKGGLRVEFKNGQCIDTLETDVENPEFLAKCGMIYDL